MLRTATYVAILAGTFVLTACGGPKLSDAKAQYDRGEYFDAAKTYRKIYNKLTKKEERKQRGEVAYQLGLCHSHLRQNARAAAAFQNAIRYGWEDSTVYLQLARELHADGKYAQAVTAYETYLQWKPGDKLASDGLAGARMGQSKALQTRYVVKSAKLFNSRRSDYAPMYDSPELDRLYFTSTNEKASGNKRSEITGMKNGDILSQQGTNVANGIGPNPSKAS